MELTVVIPAYNEESSIRDTIQHIKKYLLGSRIIVVDDKSKDKTGEMALKENVRVITHKKNMGYGAALKTGMRSAKTKYVAFLDADMTYDPFYFPSMMANMKKLNLDCIWGNRFGGTKNRMPFVRKIGNKYFAWIFFLLTGENIGDSASGQRILKTSSLKKIDFETLPDDLNFTPALSKRIVKRKLKFRVVPINYENRRGSSKLSLIRHGYKMFRSILLEK